MEVSGIGWLCLGISMWKRSVRVYVCGPTERVPDWNYLLTNLFVFIRFRFSVYSAKKFLGIWVLSN